MKQGGRTQKLLAAGLFLTLANFLGKFLGFLRDVLISNYYGSTVQTDAFFLALSIPTILIGVFTSSTDSAIIPQYSRLLEEGTDGRKRADIYFSNIISVLSLVCLIIAVFTLIFPQYIVLLFAPSYQGTALEMACGYLRLFSFIGLLHLWFCFFCSYLFCYERTSIRILLTVTTNVLVVLSLVFLHDEDMYCLSLAYLGGSLLTGLLPMWGAWHAGYRYRPVLSLKKYEFPAFIKLFLPIMGSALLADLLLYADRFLASFLPAGNLSALNYSSKIISIFDSISVVGISAVLLPAFTRLQLQKKYDTLRFTASAVYFCVGLVLFPLAIYVMLYAYEIVSFLYLRGAFTEEAAHTVALAFRAYGPQVLFSPLYALLVKTLHSMSDTRTPFRLSLVTFVLNVGLSAALVLPLGVFGIAFATTVSQLLGCGLLLGKIRRCLGLAPEFFRPANAGKLLLCGAALLAPWRLLPTPSSPFLTVLLSGCVSMALYFSLVLMLFRREIVLCKNAIKK